MSNDHQKYYIFNRGYSVFLDSQNQKTFEKYADYFIKFSGKGDPLLDVGCGTGIAIQTIKEKSNREVKGIDISKTSINICRKKHLDCVIYDGNTIPYKNGAFEVVGSYNVLEHTNNPLRFLNENVRVLKKNGVLIVVCPNFLSISNNYHDRTKGLTQKVKNIGKILFKLITHDYKFEKMPTTARVAFRPDDDACNVTNPLDIIHWANSNSLKCIYWSARSINGSILFNIVDIFPMKLILGSSFFVFKK